jgi:hypothetical protein
MARVVYLRPALFAEGRTDYYFLLPLLNRMLRDTAARLFPGAHEVEEARGIDSAGAENERAERIAAAIREYEDLIDFLVIHSDGAGDPQKVRRELVEPGIEVARTAVPGKPVPAVACIPVRELEAWLLVDENVFGEQLGLAVELPKAPDHEVDPKQLLHKLLDRRRRRTNYYEIFGEQVSFEKLRRLSAFREFEAELTQVVQSFGHG